MKKLVAPVVLFMTIGVLLVIGIKSPKVGLVGSVLAVGMCFTTLSFPVTTREAWVGSFPSLSGMGRLVVKDVIMFAGSLAALSDSARRVLAEESARPEPRCASPAPPFLAALAALPGPDWQIARDRLFDIWIHGYEAPAVVD